MKENYPGILLVNPPLSAASQAGSLSGIANRIPPLGIGYIAAMLEKLGFRPSVIDCVPLNITVDNAVHSIVEKKPDLLGITATILTLEAARILADRIKASLPRTVIVVGGPMFTSMPEKIMEENASFDLGVLGEGEYRFLKIAEKMKASGSIPAVDDIDGIVYRDNGGVVRNPAKGYIETLEDLPVPARHLFPPPAAYKPMPGGYRRLPFGHMVTSRGCPFQCIFCDRSVFGNRVRAFPAEYVLDEIQGLVREYGVKEIKFYDDLFTFSRDRVAAICDGMLQRGLDITWTCSTRVDRVSPDMLNMMKKAGCWQIDYGLESGDEEILKRVKKGATLSDARQAVQWTRQAGINARGYFVLGLPGETPETIRRTVDFAKELNLDLATFYYVALYPGNELYSIAQQEGRILHHDFNQYSSLVDTEKTRLHYVPDGMTEALMLKEISRAHRQYYLRPGYILKQLLSIRSMLDIIRLWKGFRAVLRM